ncbi:hypothetical protein WH5701_13150 [Synechococcus sp. WH 5701]|nr:hypothetical protein WH5701_13150 [Synechococcus sp. WH 5701]
MFLLVNPGCQGVAVVAGEHRNSGLGQDRASVEVLGYEVSGAAAEGDSCSEGLAHGIEAPEAGQQRWMDVDQARGEGADQERRDDPHPAGHHHQIHTGGREGFDQGAIQLLTASVSAVIHQGTGDPQPTGPLLGAAAGIVHHQLEHPAPQGAFTAGRHQRFEVGALPGGHHPKPQLVGLRGPGLCQRPLDTTGRIARVWRSGHWRLVPSLHPANGDPRSGSAGSLSGRPRL